MGDLFFILRMMIYTFFLVIIMQVKVGPTTIEEKVINFTHHSEMAGMMQNVAQGAAKFIGVSYRKATGHLKSRYMEQYSQKEQPGERLKTRLNELKESLNKKWDEKIQSENKLPEKMEESLDL